jgi:hypothetical protein
VRTEDETDVKIGDETDVTIGDETDVEIGYRLKESMGVESDGSLEGTLRELSGHVEDLRAEQERQVR